MPSAWRDGRAPVRRRILLIGLGTIALVAMHLWIGRDASVPRRSGPGDQWGYLGNARYLADSGPTWVLPEFPYFGYGYSAVLVPTFWLFDDPERMFFAIRVTNAMLLASVFPLLVVFCRRVLQVARWPAVAGGLAGALVPGAIAHSSLAVAENLVLPLVVFASLSCWALLTDRPAWQRLAFAPSIVALVVTHDRFVPAPAIMAAVLVVGVVRGLVPRRIAAVNAAMAAALLLGASALRGRIVEARWVDGIETPQGPVSEAFEVLTSWSNLGDFVMEMVGQVWYVAAGTLGLGLIGLVSLSSQVGRTSLNVEADARRFTIVFVLLSAVSVLLISSYFFYRAKNPSEGYIVGRHNDSFVPIWAATGVAFLLGERVRRRVLNAALACVGILVVLAAVLVGAGPRRLGVDLLLDLQGASRVPLRQDADRRGAKRYRRSRWHAADDRRPCGGQSTCRRARPDRLRLDRDHGGVNDRSRPELRRLGAARAVRRGRCHPSSGGAWPVLRDAEVLPVLPSRPRTRHVGRTRRAA